MKQFILTIVVLGLAIVAGAWLIQSKPEVKKHNKKPKQPTVKILTMKPQSYQLRIHTAGSVQAHTQTTLVAEVSGKITKVSNNFEEGSYVNKNETLLKIDPTDALNAIKIAKAEIAQKKLALQEQIAQGNLAKQDWDLFGEKKKQPSKLAMREPHIASAKAALSAAKIRMEQAQVNLNRSVMKAPYTGRIRERTVAVGQYVTPGSKLGKIFSTDYVEIRLPLSLADYEQLGLPEHYQGEQQPITKALPRVIFYSQTKNHYQWHGQIVRSDAALNESTRQLSVIARIDKPFSRSKTGAPPVKIGQFLQADILVKQLDNIVLIPHSAVRNNKEILLLSDNQITMHPIEILATDDRYSVVSAANLPLGKPLILTPPPLAAEGMKVKISRAKPTPESGKKEH